MGAVSNVQLAADGISNLFRDNLDAAAKILKPPGVTSQIMESILPQAPSFNFP